MVVPCLARAAVLRSSRHFLRTRILSNCRRGGDPLRVLDRRRFTSTTTSTSTTTRPIVIVGGGPVGLFLSNLLSSYKVPSIVLEAQSVEDRFKHPQAHVINVRTLEILRCHLPQIYDNVMQSIPPSKQWENFQYTHCMSAAATPLTTIRHPVHVPFQEGVDANGVLAGVNGSNASSKATPPTSSNPSLSPCTAGHLAQHTFGRILYEAGMREAERVDGSEIYYETPVTSVEKSTTNNNSNLMKVTTADGRTFESDLVVAADGSNSSLRTSNKIGWTCPYENPKQQHVMNIHLHLTPDQVSQLHGDDDGERNKNNNNYAMIYNIYSAEALAMVVCLDLDDYVVQLPYFPPLQDDTDFDAARLAPILQAIFGFPIDLKTQLQSVGKWTMATRTADSYYPLSNDNKVVLVGDAGHVFPPAGGFGMNTGIQDAHNLGWKLAWATQRKKDNDDEDDQNKWTSLFKSYDQERRPIAHRNAALSNRNYQRHLETLRQCYIHDKTPQFVTQMLNAVPVLPEVGKRAAFSGLQQTVLSSLSSLADSQSMYRKHIQSNLETHLGQGLGLPLLFPRHDLFFTYKKNNNNNNNMDYDDNGGDVDRNNYYRATDTMAPSNVKVVVGQRLPHVDINVVSWPAAAAAAVTAGYNTSTIDLVAMLARAHGQAAFCLLHVIPPGSSSTNKDDVDRFQRLAESLSAQLETPVDLVHMVTNSNTATTTPDIASDQWVVQLASQQGSEKNDGDNDGKVHDHGSRNSFSSLVSSGSGATSNKKPNGGNNSSPALILVRPDGHVAHVVVVVTNSHVSDSMMQAELLEAALQSAGV